jgi:hypothetical protein
MPKKPITCLHAFLAPSAIPAGPSNIKLNSKLRENVDDTAANVLLTSEMEDVIGDVRLPFARAYFWHSFGTADRETSIASPIAKKVK